MTQFEELYLLHVSVLFNSFTIIYKTTFYTNPRSTINKFACCDTHPNAPLLIGLINSKSSIVGNCKYTSHFKHVDHVICQRIIQSFDLIVSIMVY